MTIFAQNIDCGYTLEPPRQGDSNQYPQSMFWIKNTKNKKNMYTPVNHIRKKEFVQSKELVIIYFLGCVMHVSVALYCLRLKFFFI